NVSRSGESLVHSVAGLYPFGIYQLAGEELREWFVDCVVFADAEHSKRAHGFVAAGMNPQRKIVEVIERASAGVEKRSYVICQPELSENIHRGLPAIPGDVRFGYEHGNIRWQAVIAPHLKNVTHQGRFVVQAAPTDLARLVRVVFKGKEGEIMNTAVSLQIVE